MFAQASQAVAGALGPERGPCLCWGLHPPWSPRGSRLDRPPHSGGTSQERSCPRPHGERTLRDRSAGPSVCSGTASGTESPAAQGTGAGVRPERAREDVGHSLAEGPLGTSPSAARGEEPLRVAGCPEVEGTRQGAHSDHHQRTTWKVPETVTALRCKVGKQKQLDDRAGRPGRALGTHRAAVPSPAAPVSWASTTLGPCTPEPRTEVLGKRRVPGPARQLPGLTSWLCLSERLVKLRHNPIPSVRAKITPASSAGCSEKGMNISGPG